MPEDRSQVNVRIPKSLLQHIKQSASDEGITVSEWIKDACSKKLEGDKVTSSSEPSSTSSSGEESYKSLQQNVLALQHQIDHIRNSMPAVEDMSSKKPPNNEAELEGQVMGLMERVKLLEDNQTSHADRLGDVEENLEGLSCALPDSGDGSVGTSPQNTDTNLDITSDTDLGTNPDYIYTANTLANELGIKSRTLREQLQKLEIGDAYPRNGKQYQILSKKPYKLVLVE